MCCEDLDMVSLYYFINETFLISFVTFFFLSLSIIFHLLKNEQDKKKV